MPPPPILPTTLVSRQLEASLNALAAEVPIDHH